MTRASPWARRCPGATDAGPPVQSSNLLPFHSVRATPLPPTTVPAVVYVLCWFPGAEFKDAPMRARKINRCCDAPYEDIERAIVSAPSQVVCMRRADSCSRK